VHVNYIGIVYIMRSKKRLTKKTCNRIRHRKRGHCGTRKRTYKKNNIRRTRRVKNKRHTRHKKRGGSHTKKSAHRQLLDKAKILEDEGRMREARVFKNIAEDAPRTPGTTPTSTPDRTSVKVSAVSPATERLMRAEEGTATPPRVFKPHKGPIISHMFPDIGPPR
jgi:hypothetical protein